MNIKLSYLIAGLITVLAILAMLITCILYDWMEKRRRRLGLDQLSLIESHHNIYVKSPVIGEHGENNSSRNNSPNSDRSGGVSHHSRHVHEDSSQNGGQNEAFEMEPDNMYEMPVENTTNLSRNSALYCEVEDPNDGLVDYSGMEDTEGYLQPDLTMFDRPITLDTSSEPLKIGRNCVVSYISIPENGIHDGDNIKYGDSEEPRSIHTPPKSTVRMVNGRQVGQAELYFQPKSLIDENENSVRMFQNSKVHSKLKDESSSVNNDQYTMPSGEDAEQYIMPSGKDSKQYTMPSGGDSELIDNGVILADDEYEHFEGGYVPNINQLVNETPYMDEYIPGEGVEPEDYYKVLPGIDSKPREKVEHPEEDYEYIDNSSMDPSGDYETFAGDELGYDVCEDDKPGYEVCDGDEPGYDVYEGDEPGYEVCEDDEPGYEVCEDDEREGNYMVTLNGQYDKKESDDIRPASVENIPGSSTEPVKYCMFLQGETSCNVRQPGHDEVHGPGEEYEHEDNYMKPPGEDYQSVDNYMVPPGEEYQSVDNYMVPPGEDYQTVDNYMVPPGEQHDSSYNAALSSGDKTHLKFCSLPSSGNIKLVSIQRPNEGNTSIVEDDGSLSDNQYETITNNRDTIYMYIGEKSDSEESIASDHYFNDDQNLPESVDTNPDFEFEQTARRLAEARKLSRSLPMLLNDTNEDSNYRSDSQNDLESEQDDSDVEHNYDTVDSDIEEDPSQSGRNIATINNYLPMTGTHNYGNVPKGIKRLVSLEDYNLTDNSSDSNSPQNGDHPSECYLSMDSEQLETSGNDNYFNMSGEHMYANIPVISHISKEKSSVPPGIHNVPHTSVDDRPDEPPGQHDELEYYSSDPTADVTLTRGTPSKQSVINDMHTGGQGPSHTPRLSPMLSRPTTPRHMSGIDLYAMPSDEEDQNYEAVQWGSYEVLNEGISDEENAPTDSDGVGSNIDQTSQVEHECEMPEVEYLHEDMSHYESIGGATNMIIGDGRRGSINVDLLNEPPNGKRGGSIISIHTQNPMFKLRQDSDYKSLNAVAMNPASAWESRA